MGAKISKEPLEAPNQYPPVPIKEGQPRPVPVSDPMDIQCVSQSRFFCFVQQAALWSDYFAVYDQRTPGEYNKNRIVMAQEASPEDDDLEWAWDMLVLVYGKSHNDPKVNAFVQKLQTCENPPKGIFVLEGSVKKFLKRYPVVGHKSDCADSLPAPVELVPPTATHPGTYAIHRVHFLRAKAIVSRLYCSTIINVSSRRLFVKSPGINLENTAFDDDPTPEDFVVTAYMKYASQKPKGKGKGNILIIDESGCDYASILAGWHLIKHRNISLEDAIESMTARIGFLDTWYTDVLTSWCEA